LPHQIDPGGREAGFVAGFLHTYLLISNYPAKLPSHPLPLTRFSPPATRAQRRKGTKGEKAQRAPEPTDGEISDPNWPHRDRLQGGHSNGRSRFDFSLAATVTRRPPSPFPLSTGASDTSASACDEWWQQRGHSALRTRALSLVASDGQNRRVWPPRCRRVRVPAGI